MNDIKIISEVGICLWIIWNMTRNILFAKKRDEREILSIFNALKTTIIFAVFILGLIIILNLLNGVTSLSIMYIFIIAIISCFCFVLLYKLNINTDLSFFNFLNKMGKGEKSKLIWNTFCITLVTDLIMLFAIFISYKYFASRGLKVLTILAYILACISEYSFCQINVKNL
ncbi:hypothetical protein [Clostridium estertheticum]|uniref:hypothetical protein n=1 Tax=Clostridium estertheticum TaxID=238834 RepID=UPI001C6DF4EA|nr:hypothetical protein [Clostridium estertheticum]MBW9173119.1 hypothetical protein [Clostridium estertheticum]MBX4264438.1 hypothetical protein [Clostridium estertheticum]MBX4271337.1 hypothetical protein [Clostridium estertheticum]WLC77234.1 hypothetical protein KTC99_10780 [Clostridium estertheticum]WLC78251.1 hypothetical protein KTC98_13510 [Clostridium estertheticum]